MATKKILMECGKVQKSLTIDHAERILGNPKSSKSWKISKEEQGFKLKDGKLISTKGTGTSKDTSK